MVSVFKAYVASDLNDFCPVVRTLILMKGSEKLVLKYIKYIIQPSLDLHQFAFKKDLLKMANPLISILLSLTLKLTTPTSAQHEVASTS